jgi:PAS domain S-box-containing protein
MREKTKKRKLEDLRQGPVTGKNGKTNSRRAKNKNGPAFLDILDVLPFYVLLIDSDHYIIHANKAVQAELGVDPKQIIGGYCPKVIHGLDTQFPGCPLEESVAKGQAVEREVFDRNTGRWLSSAIYPTNRYTQDNKKIFFHLVTDITTRKQAEGQLKTSHERLRSLSAHLETVREEERKRIARDLHDETSQVVASLSAHLEAAAKLLPPSAGKAKHILRKAQELSVSILDELHRVIYELHPFLVDDLGPVTAIESLIDNSLKATGVKVRLKTVGKVRRLDRQTEMTLFRVIQEALSNIVWHAHAKNVSVSFRFQTNSVRVRITDDGVGFDVEKATDASNRPHGFGVLGMRERIELINGNLSIRSHPGSGTKINIEVPSDSGKDDTQKETN